MRFKIEERNAEIVRKRKAGASYKAIASEFGLSRSRVEQIVNRYQEEEKRQEQSRRLLSEIRIFDDIDKKWPTEILIQGLRFPERASQRLTEYFGCLETKEISLRNIMDFLITDYEKVPYDLYDACPAYQKHIGGKTYVAIVNHLSEQDLGHAFDHEWNKRLRKLMHFIETNWDHIPEPFRKYGI